MLSKLMVLLLVGVGSAEVVWGIVVWLTVVLGCDCVWFVIESWAFICDIFILDWEISVSEAAAKISTWTFSEVNTLIDRKQRANQSNKIEIHIATQAILDHKSLLINVKIHRANKIIQKRISKNLYFWPLWPLIQKNISIHHLTKAQSPNSHIINVPKNHQELQLLLTSSHKSSSQVLAQWSVENIIRVQIIIKKNQIIARSQLVHQAHICLIELAIAKIQRSINKNHRTIFMKLQYKAGSHIIRIPHKIVKTDSQKIIQKRTPLFHIIQNK